MILFRDGNNYPYEIYETNSYILILEGRIYGIDPLNDSEFLGKIESIFKNTSSGTSGSVESETEYFQHLDGEFIIYLIGRKGDKIIVLNDYLGRLPQYYIKGKQFIVSRDIFVLDKVTTGLLFDDSTMYQFLRLGFPLGNRTLFHDIERLGHSSLIKILDGELYISQTPIIIGEMEGSRIIDKPEKELYERFQKAVKDRFSKEGPFVVSLSGGLDSRVIMGEIEKRHYAAEYASFVYDNSIINDDLAISKELGRHFNRSPQVFKLKEYSPEAFDELTMAKGGMNYLGMAFLIRYLMDLGHSFNFMLTGDGGDKTLPFLFPPSKVKAKHLSKYILRNYEVSSKKTLDSFLLSDIDAEEDRIINYLEQLEGKNADIKYKNFLLFERAKNWLFEGEDRNRNYLWSTSPFYQPAFFKLAHSLPEQQKKNFGLFRDFTRLVDPALNSINNANWGIPLGEKKKLEQMQFRQKIKSLLPKPLFRQASHLKEHKEMASMVASLMHKGYGGQLSVYADQHDLNAASSETIFHLITLLKVSEMSWRGI